MECQARNVRHTKATTRASTMMPLSSSGRLTEGASLVDALRTELATAPRPPTGLAPTAPVASSTGNSNNNNKHSSSLRAGGTGGTVGGAVTSAGKGTGGAYYVRPPVYGVNNGVPTARYTQDSMPWSGMLKHEVIPW